MVSFLFFSFLLMNLFNLNRCTSYGSKGNWSYLSPGGTKYWKHKFNICNGKGQSPIDIITSLAFPRKFEPIVVKNYDIASSQILLTNNGKTVVGELHQDPTPLLTGGGLSTKFIGHSFHFHWGNTDEYGSEHYKDGTSYPMEMHIVHFSSKYSDLKEAVDKPQGLAVLGFFFTIATVNNTVLQSIIEKLPLIEKTGSNTKVDGQLGLLLPKNLKKFYRYLGSLTTPPCFESVIWTVFDETIPISMRQLKEFRTRMKWSQLEESKTMGDNFREIQPLFMREVYTNKAGIIQHKAFIVNLMIAVHFLLNPVYFLMISQFIV